MQRVNLIHLLIFVSLLILVTDENSYAQPLDPYRRVTDPRGICRLDGPDTLPVQFGVGVGWTPIRNNDGYYICAQGTGTGIITHLWMEYYGAKDSLLHVKIWIDDSLIVYCGIQQFYKSTHGMIRRPFDSVASGGFDCDVQMPYKHNFKVSFFYENDYCCLFWAVEYRPIADSNQVESFRPNPSKILSDQQTAAEKAYWNTGSPWNTQDQKNIKSSLTIPPGQTAQCADISGPAMINILHFLPSDPGSPALRNVRLKIFWDNSPFASVDAPLLDFFGCGAGLRDVRAFQVRANLQGEMTSYLPMPFFRHARIELLNSSNAPISIATDVSYSQEPVDRWNEGYFTTQYFVSNPARWRMSHPVGKMLGRGKYIGVQFTWPENPPSPYDEGDPIFSIDSNSDNAIHYIGLEDYLDGGWSFLEGSFSLPFAGCTNLFTSGYRFHYFDAYDFHSSFNFDLMHGVQNDIRTIYRSVAFFYKRWTPFWVAMDTIHALETWAFGGSGYTPNEQIHATMDGKSLFTTSADTVGNFTFNYVVPVTTQLGIHRIAINNVIRPEPIWMMEKPTVRFMYDTLSPVFRWKDSLMIVGTGFKPGEKVKIFLDTTEVAYLSTDRFADQNYGFAFSVRLPWVEAKKYWVKALGDAGTTAQADTALFITRSYNFECEDLTPIVAEANTEFSYLGYYYTDVWSNQSTRLFYPTAPNQRLILSLFVPVADSFRVTLFNTIGARYGNYDIFLDKQLIQSYYGFLDTGWNVPFRSKPVEGGIHYLTKGIHTITYLCTGKDQKALDYLLNADNIILSPTTPFHALPKDTSSSVDLLEIKNGDEFALSPNPLSGNLLNVFLNLDSSFECNVDWLKIEIYDLLGRRVATVLDGSLGIPRLNLTQDCSALPSGRYICSFIKITPHGITKQSRSLIIDK